ncbi:MAG: outer membrane protein [Vicinamibacterales bacterium]
MRGSIRLAPLLLVVACLFASPRTASADTWLTPYIGSTFNVDFGGYDPGRALVYGASATWLGDSGVGLELDLGYAPNFFEPEGENFFDFGGTGNETTLMANLVVAPGGGAVRPYITGGVGLMRSSLSSPLDIFSYSDSAFGLNAGGGLRVGGAVGLRADVRYFRQLQDVSPINAISLGNFSFWRGTVGVSFGF